MRAAQLDAMGQRPSGSTPCRAVDRAQRAQHATREEPASEQPEREGRQSGDRGGEGAAGAAIRLRALRFIANLHLENDTPDLALAAADAGVRLARETGLMWTYYGVDLHLLRGWALMASGRWDEVVERAAITMYEPAPTASILGIQLVAVLVARQDPEAPAALARLRAVPDVAALPPGLGRAPGRDPTGPEARRPTRRERQPPVRPPDNAMHEDYFATHEYGEEVDLNGRTTTLTFWHRPLRDVVGAFLDADLRLRVLDEPPPAADTPAELMPPRIASGERTAFLCFLFLVAEKPAG